MKGQFIMGKNTEDMDLKGWEKEIDSAVDRLFVEGKKGSEELFPLESSLETSLPPPHASFHFLRAIEAVEAQLLSLEWEINRENLSKAKKEIADLRGVFKDQREILTVLQLIEKILNEMDVSEMNIRPPQIQFLMDAMQTIKLLMKGDQDVEINTYKRLASSGIEARFSCLEREKEPPRPLASSLLTKARIDSAPEREMRVTIFKVGGKWFGVESDRVFKLYKVPKTVEGRFSNAQIVRLRDIEVKWIDLKKFFSIPERGRIGEGTILTVKENEGYKGWMVAQEVKRISGRSDTPGRMGEYCSGVIHWTDQGDSIEIPILNLKKL